MAEYIEREAALEAAKKSHLYFDLKPIINSVHAANVRPVVLCKDCEYCRRVDEFEYWCDGFCSPARLVRKDDFCSHGKAKE